MEAKKKILIFSDCYLFGGSEYVVVNILNNSYLSERFDFHFSYRKHALYQSSLKNVFSEEQISKFYPLRLLSNDNLFYRINTGINNKVLRQICKFPFRLLFKFNIYNNINRIIFKRFLKKKSLDLLFINNGGYPAATTCLDFAIAASKMNYKVIMQLNNIPRDRTASKRRKTDIPVAHAVSRFITASKYVKSSLSDKCNFLEENITSIPNMIKLKKIIRTKEQIYKELGINDDITLVTEVALLHDRKGQLELLKAVLHIKKHHPPYYDKLFLLLIGNGENEELLKKYIKENNLKDHVTMLGYRFDFLDYVSASNILALPSLKNEDMPLILLQAMALGKLIISTKIAGIPELIIDKESGLLLDVNSSTFIEDLAESIIMLLSTDNNALGENAKNRYDKLFSEDRYVKAIEQVFLKTIQK